MAIIIIASSSPTCTTTARCSSVQLRSLPPLASLPCLIDRLRILLHQSDHLYLAPSFSLSFFPLTMSHCRRWRPVAPALCAHQAQNWPPFSSFSFVPASRPFSPSCSGGHSGGQRYGSQCVCQPVSTVHRIDVVFVVVQQQYSVVFSRLAFPLFLPLSFTTNNSQWKCVSTLCWTG